MLRLLLAILLASILDASQSTGADESTNINIAFVFAGEASSLICPKVARSIRGHLIDSLGGNAYVFIRLALEDGRSMDSSTIPSRLANESLALLRPTALEYYSASQEASSIEVEYPMAWKDNQVLRRTDRRRHSMLFQRAMAYRMVTSYEKSHHSSSFIFDWVVLSRLDTAWLRPVLPIHLILNSHVWLPHAETGMYRFGWCYVILCLFPFSFD
jgi:hypothetical protein